MSISKGPQPPECAVIHDRIGYPSRLDVEFCRWPVYVAQFRLIFFECLGYIAPT